MSNSTFPAVQCEECGALFGYEPEFCRECLDKSLKRREISGRGEVYTQTTIRVPGSDCQGEEPFVIAVIDVGDAVTVRITARVRGFVDIKPTDKVMYIGSCDGAFYFQRQKDS